MREDRRKIIHLSEPTVARRRDIPLCRRFARGEGLAVRNGTKAPTCPECLEIAQARQWVVRQADKPGEVDLTESRHDRELAQLRGQRPGIG